MYMTGFCYGCPPIMDDHLSKRLKGHVITCIAGDDIVARLSCYSVKALKVNFSKNGKVEGIKSSVEKQISSAPLLLFCKGPRGKDLLSKQ